MIGSFDRCVQAMRNDTRGRTRWMVAAGLLIAGGWAAWGTWAPVTVYAVTREARLEVLTAAHPVAAPVSGRILVNDMELGRKVNAGDLLVVLDHEALKLQHQEMDTRRAAYERELQAVLAEVQAHIQALDGEAQAASAALEEARVRGSAAQALAQYSQQVVGHYLNLGQAGRAAPLELLRSQASATEADAQARALDLAVERVDWDWRCRQNDRHADLAEARGRAVHLQGEIAALEAGMTRIAHDIERHHVRAVTAGQLGEVACVRPGSMVNAGASLGVIIPAGEVHIVAEFEPARALGRIRAGQPASMRLDGFSWTQYGTVHGRVVRVASEVRDRRVRVEVAVESMPDLPIDASHGLPGSVEIAVERLTPAALVLRSAGCLLTQAS